MLFHCYCCKLLASYVATTSTLYLSTNATVTVTATTPLVYCYSQAVTTSSYNSYYHYCYSITANFGPTTIAALVLCHSHVAIANVTHLTTIAK